MGLEEAVYLSWEESEAGWETRPDGFSLHLTVQDAHRFVHDYWKKMPDSVPDTYARPAGTPYPVKVGERLYEDIRKSGYGIKHYDEEKLVKDGELVFIGGRNGWVSG